MQSDEPMFGRPQMVVLDLGPSWGMIAAAIVVAFVAATIIAVFV